jgi:hypothetical protein
LSLTFGLAHLHGFRSLPNHTSANHTYDQALTARQSGETAQRSF